MADFAQRGEYEGRIARAMARVFRQHKRRLLDELGDPPDINNIAPAVWDDYTAALVGAIRPILIEAYLAAAEQQFNELFAAGRKAEITFEWGGINAEAAVWAQQYTYDLVKGLTDTTRRSLQSAVSRWFEEDMTIADLARALEPAFGPVRAEMIAVTEVTRAAVQGQLAIRDEIEQAGFLVEEVWQTANDEKVCAICSPRNNKPEGTNWQRGEEPPAHPRCRCQVVLRFKQ